MKKFLFFLFCYSAIVFSAIADTGGNINNNVITVITDPDRYTEINGTELNIDGLFVQPNYPLYTDIDVINNGGSKNILFGYASIKSDHISNAGNTIMGHDWYEGFFSNIHVYSDSNSEISNFTFSNNGIETVFERYGYYLEDAKVPSSLFGGAIALYDVNKNVSISDTTFNGNYLSGGGSYVPASEAEGAKVHSYRFGGAIANFTDTDHTLNVNNSEFRNNHVGINQASSTDFSDIETPTINSAKIMVELAGGAVANGTKMTINNSTFDGNFINNGNNNSNAYGGAIANRGGILTITDTSFTDNKVYNSAEANTFGAGSVYGGAIANYKNYYQVVEPGQYEEPSYFYDTIQKDLGAPTVNIIAKNKDVVFRGNGVRQAASGNFTSNALYNADSGVVNLEANAGHKIIFYDGIDGDETGSINVNNGSGTIVIANTVQNNKLGLYGGTVQLGTSDTNESNFVKSNKYFDNAPITVYGNSTLSIQNGKIDNIIDLGNISFDGATPVLSLAMDIDLATNKSDSLIGTNGGNTTQIVLNNIKILNDLGTSSQYTFNLNFGDLTNNITYDLNGSISSNLFEYDLKYENGILSLTRNANSANGINKTVYNQAISMRALSRVQHDLTESILSRDTNLKFDSNTRKLVFAKKKAEKTNDSNSNVWLDIFGNKQDVKYNVISNTEEDYFSAVLGVSSDVYKLDNGITTYGNIYLGYLNGNQKYTDHNKIQNDGFYVGTSVLADYNDLLFDFTANFGYVDNEASNSSGKDNYDNYWLTLGTKFAYNWNVGGSYFLEPGINFSYVSMKNDSYTSKLGVRIDEDNLNSFQISPALRFTKIFEGNSSLSLKVRYVIELVKDLKAKVGDFNINELGNGHYVEYGLSYDDIITDWFAINLELDRRDGDVRGWTGGANFKFMF